MILDDASASLSRRKQGFSRLGSASEIKRSLQNRFVSNNCPINIYGRAMGSTAGDLDNPHESAAGTVCDSCRWCAD